MENPFKKNLPDPTTSSPVAENLNLIKTDDLNVDTGSEIKKFEVYREPESGEKFFTRKEHSSYEYFITLFSKGILNISDIIEKDGKLYSREMPVSNIENKSSKEDIKSEIFLLSFLFNDKDHVPELNHNFREEGGKFVHFDYDGAFSWKQDGKPIYSKNIPTTETTKRELRQFFNKEWYPMHLRNKKEVIENEKNLDEKEFKIILLQKTDQFIDRLNDVKFFDAIIEKSGIDFSDEKFSFLRGNSDNEKALELKTLMIQRLVNLREALGLD